MTVAEAIAHARAMRETALEDTLLTHLLSELEGRVQLELHRADSWRDTGLLSVDEPWSRLYWTYLVAMIDFAAGDTARYEESAALFAQAYEAYARYCQRTRSGT